MFNRFLTNSSLLGEKVTRTKNSNVNHTTQTPSTYVKAGSVSISIIETVSVPLFTISVLLTMELKASWVSRQNVVIDTKMKNKEAKAMNCNKKKIKKIRLVLPYYIISFKCVHLQMCMYCRIC